MKENTACEFQTASNLVFQTEFCFTNIIYFRLCKTKMTCESFSSSMNTITIIFVLILQEVEITEMANSKHYFTRDTED